ncbi:MAG: DUF1499 domain-containing protein [Rhodocyclaceae bacterium]
MHCATELASIMYRLLPAFSLAALSLLVIAALGTRTGLWSYVVGFQLVGLASCLALVAGGLAFGRLLTGSAGRPAGLVVALVAALATLAMPLHGLYRVSTVPMIHDISTDTDDPPRFVELAARRQAGENPAEYAGRAVAEAQRAAYPDLRPLASSRPPQQAFEHALAVAGALGWEIVAREPMEGRIEATYTSPWFGFTDDIVIRVRPDERGGSRVDVRSMSRVGRSDLGANAARLRAFAARFER